jgi:excisionase family DNA binding protein
MASNIKITKTCEYCGKEFTARTTVTRYCSHKCNQKHYKQVKREEKIKEAKEDKPKVNGNGQLTNYDELNIKQFLSIKEACILIGVSERTFYRLIQKDIIQAAKIGRRTIIKRSEIDKLFTI